MAASIELAGMAHHVPEVRIVRLADKLPPVVERGEELPLPRRDLLSVEVTRRASGPGEYKLTLSNWDRDLLRNRYNDFAELDLGTRLRIDMRYLLDPGIDGDLEARRAAQEKTWVPMISGPITDMQFSLGGDGDRVSISGEDDLRPLKDHADKKVAHNKQNERTIFEKTLEDAKYPLPPTFDDKLPEHLRFLGDLKDTINEVHEKGQSPLEFLQKFVDKYDLELFLEFDRSPDRAPPWPLVLRVAASRASTGPGNRTVETLERDRHLIDFAPAIKGADVFTSVRVRGRDRHRNEPKGIDRRAGLTELLEELAHYRVPGEPQLISAIGIREARFGKNESDERQKTNLDEYRGEAAARAILMRKARELLTVEATAIGRPDLAPGQFVKLEGVAPPFGGRYYVTSTTHTWGSDGMRTRFSACRPGMPYAKVQEPEGAKP